MVSYLSWAANAVLFVAGCFLAASTANTIFAAMLAPPDAERSTRSEAPPARTASWSDRQIILDRNLFKSSTLEDAAPVAIEEEIEETKLPLKLLGTAAAEDPRLAWAAVQDTQKRETRVVTTGDDLMGKATVLRIERRRIVLLENGAHRELALDEDTSVAQAVRSSRAVAARAASARSRSRVGRRRPDVRQLAEDRFAMDRTDVESALRSPANILSQARFLPKYDGGEMVGFQVSSIKPGSVLKEFGIQNGDLITEFNGITIDSPTESARLLQELSESDVVRLKIQGVDGSDRDVEVDLRE